MWEVTRDEEEHQAWRGSISRWEGLGRRRLGVDSRVIDDQSPAYCIAEIGHNHQGSAELCCDMIRAAQRAGASAVKLQKRSPKDLYADGLYMTPVEHEHAFARVYGDHRTLLELTPDGWEKAIACAQDVGITLFSTAFDFPSADFLRERKMPAYKIASGDCTNIPLIKHVASFGKPLFISTGGASLDDVLRIYYEVSPVNPDFCLLQCTVQYPSDPAELNLRVIETYRQRFPDKVIGLSDHHAEPYLNLVAYGLGARVFEKHFTLDRNMKGTDQGFSLKPHEFGWMVATLETARLALGDGVKSLRYCESGALFERGKGLHAARDLIVGEALSPADIAILSPMEGMRPYELKRALGRKLLVIKKRHEPIFLSDVGLAP